MKDQAFSCFSVEKKIFHIKVTFILYNLGFEVLEVLMKYERNIIYFAGEYDITYKQ